VQANSSKASAIPRLTREVLLETTSETSANVSLGDVNGDGHLDVVLAKGRHWPLVDRVLLGDGQGRFPTAYDLGAASDRTYSGLLVDLDGDGDLDVVISNDRPDPKLVYLNDGKGRFQAGTTFGKPEWSTRNASVADLNGDGLPDIVVANRTGGGTGANYVCLNRGAGRFDEDCVEFSQESATTITPADFNRDGRIDLVVPHRDGGQSYLYMNEGGAGPIFRKVPFGPADAAVRVSEAADLDVDGRVDIVTVGERSGVTIFFGQEGEKFAPGVPAYAAPKVPYAVAVGDVNRDGAIDILVGNVEAPSDLLLNDGSGRGYSPVPFGDDKGTVYGFALGDVDRDGHIDVAAARSGAPNVLYLAEPGRR
jgi:hypothetical protein